MILQADAIRLPFADQIFDLCVGSPPYVDARLYLEDGKDLGISRNAREWVDWMLNVTAECLRVTKGPVIWVAAGVTRDRTYWPACEGLMWRWFETGGSAYRPCYWHRYGIPGSGHDDWFRGDVEYCMVFKRHGGLPWADNTACGHAPRFGPGGHPSNRTKMGHRVNQWGGNRTTGGARNADGSRQKPGRPSHATYVEAPPALANPGNLISTGASGGNSLGHRLAHESEAPYPEAVPRFFIRSHSPPGGLVLDPFAGSGTTGAAALLEDRRYVLADLRISQCRLARRRIGPNPDRYGIKDNPSLAGPRSTPLAPMPGQMSLLDGAEDDGGAVALDATGGMGGGAGR